MTTLADEQFEILPSEDATDGFVFGIGADVSVNDGGFDPGENEWITQDGQNTRRGVRGFGRDVLGAKTWVWESHTNRSDAEGALETLDAFSAYWMPELLVMQPGEQTCLRYRIGSRERRIYGRPRRYAAPPSNLVLSGYVPITHDFACVDSFTYDDVESMAVMPYSSTVEGGGFTFPLTFPVTTQSSEGYGGGQLDIGGNARAYPIIRFNGPWLNPVLITDNWTLEWDGEIGPVGWIEIDTRPWALTVLDQSGGSAMEGLSRRTYLEDMWFAPGSRPQISLAGASTSGSANATIRWRNAWTSI